MRRKGYYCMLTGTSVAPGFPCPVHRNGDCLVRGVLQIIPDPVEPPAPWWRRCRRKGHDWFPDREEASEFIVITQVCLRCHARRALLPWGECLGGHPIREHYNRYGHPKPVMGCRQPT